MGSYAKWAVGTNISTATGTTTLKAAPAAGTALYVQKLAVVVTTAAAQAFDIESDGGAVELFKAPVSLATTTPVLLDYGEAGVALPAATALVYTATAGVGLTIAASGEIR